MKGEPPVLTVGTEVSAKYKGAFCEAKVKKVIRNVRVQISLKSGGASQTITEDCIRGILAVGTDVSVKVPESRDWLDATITKIKDYSQYTVVFDDGDINSLRRSALCLKSGRHFAEGETLDQLPLTHPEHFGTPVQPNSARRGRRTEPDAEDSEDDAEDDDDEPDASSSSNSNNGNSQYGKQMPKVGEVICILLGEKKRQKDNWIPGLVVAPTAQDTCKIKVASECLVRSFQDGRYYTVPKKEMQPFTRETGARADTNTLRAAVEKAFLYLDKDELPPHWDRDVLFGRDMVSDRDSSDDDASDDESREQKDHFVAQLIKFMDESGTPINKAPMIGNIDLDLYRLFKIVKNLGGFNRVNNHSQWKTVYDQMGLPVSNGSAGVQQLKAAYKKHLQTFEDFNRKLGCTFVPPRTARNRHSSARSLVRVTEKSRVYLPGTMKQRNPRETRGRKPKAKATLSPNDPGPSTSTNIPSISGEQQTASSGDVFTAPTPVKGETSPPSFKQPAKKRGRKKASGKKKVSRATVARPEKKFVEPAPSPQPSTSGTKASTPSVSDTKSERDVGSDDSDWEFVDEVPKIKKTSRRRSSNASGLDVILKPEVPAKDVVAEDKLPSQVQDSSASAKQQPEVQESAGEPSSAPVASTSSDIVDDVEVGHRVRVLFTAGTSPGNKKRKSNVDSKNPPQDYEAKVLAGRVADGRQEYLVHYTGWNPRWDEWVARSQIILNLTKPFPGQQDYVPSPRGNRGRRRGRGGKAGAASSREKSDGETSQQRGKPSASKKVPEREDGGAPASSSTSVSAATRSRSGTPSSIVSSSSRGSSMQPRTRSPSVSLSPSISAGSSASYDPLLSGGSADGWRIRAQKRRGGSVGSGSSSGPRKRICPPSGHAGAADKVKDSEKSKPTAVGDSSSSEDEEDDDDDEDSDEEDEEEDGESSGSEAESEEDDRESRASSSKAISAKKPSAAAEVRKAPVVAEVKKPSVVAEVKKPSVVAEVKKPSVVPEVKKPSVVPEVKKSTTAVAEVKKSTTAVAEVKKLLVVAEVKKPSAAAKIESVDVVKQSPQGVVKIVGNSQPSTSVAAAKLMPSPASKAAEKTKQKTEELEKTSVRKPKTPKPTATVQAGSKTPEHPTIAESFVMLKRTTAVPSLPPSPSPSVPVVAASAPAASPPPTNPVPAAQSNKAESPSKVQKPAKAAKKRKSDAIDSKSDSAPEDVAAAAEKVSSLKAFREQRSPPAKMDKPSPSPSRSKQSSSGEDVDIYEFQDADEFQQPMEMKFNVGPRRWGSGSAKPPTPVASPTSAPVVAPLVAPTVAPLVIPPVAPPMSPTVAPLVTPTVAPPVTPSVSSTPSSPVPLPSPAPTTPVSPLAQVPVPTPAPISVPTRAPTPTQVQMMSPVAAAPPKHVVPAAAKPRTPPPATPPSTPYAMAFPPVAAAVNLSPPPAPVRAPSPAPVSQVVPQVPPPPPPPRLVPRPALSPISPPPRAPLMQPILTAPLVAMDLSKPAPMEPTDLSRTAGTMILHVSDHRSDPHDQKRMLVASPMSSPPQTEPLPLRREAVVDSPRSSPRSATPLVVRTPPPLPSPTSSSMSIGGPLPSLPRSNLVMPPRLSPISPPTPMQLPPSSGCNIPPMGPMLMPTGSVPLSLAMSIAPMLMPQPPRSLPSPMFGHLPPQQPMQIPMSMPLSLSMPPVAPPPSVTSSISLASLSILMSDRMPMPPQPPAAHMRLPHYDPPSRPPIMPIVPAPPYGLSPTQPPPPGPMHMSMANMGMPMGPIPCSVAASMPMSMGMPIPMDIDRPLALDTPRHMREDSRSCGWTIEAARASPGVPSHMPHQFNMMEAVPKRYQHPISRPEVTKMSPVHRVERPLELPRAMVEQTRVTEPPPRVVERPQVSPVHIQIPTSVPYAAVQAPTAAAKPVKTPAMAVARKPKTAWAHMQQASSTAVELPSPSPPTAVASVPCSSSASMSASASSPGSVGSPSTSSSASSSPSPFPTVSSVVEPLLTEAARRSPKPRTGPSFRATPIPKSSEPVSQSTHHTGRKWKSEAVARETAKGKLKEQEEARPRIVHQPTPEPTPAPAPRTPHADDAAAARRQDAPTVDTSASQPSTSSALAPGSGSGSRGHAFLCLETIPVSPPSSPVSETREEAEEEEKVEKPVRQPIKLKMKRMEEETGSAGSTSGAGQKLKESGVNSGEGHGSHLRTEDAGGESGIARPSGSNPACHPPTLNASAAVELPQVAPTMSTPTPVHVAGPQGGTASRRRGRKRRGGASGAAAAGGRVRKNSGKKSDLDVSVANAEDGGEDGEVDLRRVLVGHEHLLEPVDPTWDEDQIDTELTRRLQEAKTVYHGLKAEVASIDRRRRRFLKKRGERGDQS